MFYRSPQMAVTLISMLVFSLPLISGTAFAGGPWRNLEAKHVSVFYKSPAQLEKFIEKIRPRGFSRTFDDLYLSSRGDRGNDPGGIVDRLFLRVQRILDMKAPGSRVKIMVCSGQKEVSRCFKRYMGYDMNAPAFYFKRKNVIYVHLEKLHAGILAHEMAHAVIEHSLGAPRGSHASEALCRYVDRQIMSNGY